jgi:hypothetical protein
MINQAGWGVWVWIVMSVMFMGPMMRMMFGTQPPPWLGGKWDKKGKIRRAATGRVHGEVVDQMEKALGERDMVIEDLQRRLSEMESRLDFTERLLSERSHATGG